MSYKNGNYSAFYVDEPFSKSNLGASATKDFLYYNRLKTWKLVDNDFPFNDSHEKNYNVRDSSDWERTLKPRLHDRINNSKNIVLFLSSITKNSRSLREEIDYGINTKGLPVIVIYPEFSETSDIITCEKQFKQQVIDLWDHIPKFRDSMINVPTLHVPNKKELIKRALEDSDLMVNTKCKPNTFFYL